MRVFALDTCCRGILAAAAGDADGKVLQSIRREGSLAVSIPQVVTQLVDRDTQAVVVLIGPGSYTGIRAGIAAATGVVSASGATLHAVDRLAAAAATSSADRIACLLDAGRGLGYAQRFTRAADGTLAAESEPEHVAIAGWSPPDDHHRICDAAFGGAEVATPEAIVGAALKLGISRPASAITEIVPLYVSQPKNLFGDLDSTFAAQTPPVS